MEHTPEFERKERELAARFEEAARIVRTAEAQSSVLTSEESSRVLELMARVRILERQMGHLHRHEQHIWSNAEKELQPMMRAHYVAELESVKQNLINMGETTISLLTEAMHAVVVPNPGSAARASELEAQTDHQHRLIHDQCLNLITLQAPVAGDARLLTGALDANNPSQCSETCGTWVTNIVSCVRIPLLPRT